MTILQDLFYGNIAPNAGSFDRKSKYGKTIEVLTDREEKLLATLKEPEKKLFTDFSDAQTMLTSITAEEKFIQGFRMGAIMMIEVIGSRKDKAWNDY